MTIPKQHSVKEKTKDVDADRHGLCWTFRDGKCIVANKMDVEGTICQHFNIRGYVARAREVNENICWPFPRHALESRKKEKGNWTLPPLEVSQFRWWNCRKCVDGTKTSSERVVEKNKPKSLSDSSQACDGHSDPEYLMFGRQMSPANANLQKCKENMLNYGEMAEHLTVELKSNNATSSCECETDKNKRDEIVVTNETIGKNETIASMGFQVGNSETAHSREEKNGGTHYPSKFGGNSDTSEKHEHETVGEKGSAEKVQKISSTLEGEVEERLESKVNKSDAFHNLNHASNSWEYFSRSKNIFEQISKNIRENQNQHDTTNRLSLISQNCVVNPPGLESKRPGPENNSIASVTVSFDKYVHLGQQTLASENNKERISEKVRVQTLESNIKEGDRSLRVEDARDDIQCINSIESSDFVHKDRSTCVAGKECLNLPTNQGSLDTDDLISKQMEKFDANESKCKRKLRKKRSIADIIASDSVPESCNKEMEKLNSGDAMQEDICRADNHEQFQVQEDGMKDPKHAGTSSPKSRIERTNISEVHRTTGIKNVKQKKWQPEKPRVKKKQQGLEVQSCNDCSTSAKDSSNTGKHETVSNMIHLPEGASKLVSTSKEKVFQDNSIQLEDRQMKQRCSEMDDDIPMDVVELMARNQRERGLSKPPKTHKRKRDDSGVNAKVKETNASRANKHIKRGERGRTDIKKGAVKPVKRGGRDAKKGAAKPKSLEEFKQIKQENLQAFLKTCTVTSAAGDDSHVHVSQMSSTSHSFISDMEVVKPGIHRDLSAMLQSPELFNPCRKYSNLMTPMLSGTNVARNLPPLSVNNPNSNVAVSGSVQEGACCTREIAPASQQVTGASKDCAHMQINNLLTGGSDSFSKHRGPVFSNSYNNREPSFYFTGECTAITPTQNLRNSEVPKLTGNSDLDRGQNSSISFHNHKGKAISNLLGKPDGVFFPPFFKGQSNSALLQQVNAQARPIFGNKQPVPVSSPPVLRLMGQSVSVPVNCGMEQNIVTENKDRRTFSELLQASSQKHLTWFHPLTCASSGVTYEDRMDRIYGPKEDRMSVKEQPQRSKTTVPPVPKFSSNHLVSNGHSDNSGSSCTVPSKSDFVLESSIANKKFPFEGASLFLMQQKNDLQCINDDNRNRRIFSTLSSTSQTTEFAKGVSHKKGIRSYRRSPTIAQPNKYHTAAAHSYPHNRDHFQSSLILGTNPKQSQTESTWNSGIIPKESLAEEAEAARISSPNKGNDKSTLFGKSSCNTEICTLNQNPAEIIIDDGGHTDGFGYEHLGPVPKSVSRSKGREDIQIPNGQKRRRTLKKKHLQEFLAQKNGQASDLTNTNVGTVRQEMTNVRNG